MKQFLLVIFGLSILTNAWGQSTFIASGKVVNENSIPLENVYVLNGPEFLDYSASDGSYSVVLPAGQKVDLVFIYQGSSILRKIKPQQAGSSVNIDVKFGTTVTLPQAEVKGKRKRDKISVITVDPKVGVKFPVMQFEDVITTMALGTFQQGGELSSAYNVRGGNFDENLVYVNDIEVYRPFLVRSGQAEGLSFINPDMVEKVEFSAGGFEAKYGDKLSSVLDVTYNKPKEFDATVQLSMMGAQVHAQDISKDRRFSYVIGARYRTNQYLLNTLDVSGSYQPRFTDIQSLFSYKISSKLKADFFTSFASNSFLLVPESRSTSFGTVQSALRLFVAFGGAELTEYQTFLNGLTFQYQFSDSSRIKWVSSVFTSDQKEHYTVEGAYRLDQLENNLGSEDFGESVGTLGAGYFINHARNDLDILVHNHKIMGTHIVEKARFDWGVKYQQEIVDDRLKEWNYNDSSGYNVARGRNGNEEIVMDDYLSTKADLSTHRYMGYGQWSSLLSKRNNFRMNAGVRANYWSLNKQTVVSPRMQLSFEPNKAFNDALVTSSSTLSNIDSLRKRDWLLKFAAGYYYQPPFYRELRNDQGVLNPELRAQRSIHLVAGGDMEFEAWGRPFRFITEAYYKILSDLVPYYLDNVRIRYAAENSSTGFARGLDARVNGEFIKGLESWINISFLETREKITYTNSSGEEIETEFLRRPTDQRFNASILFQDELKSDPSFKMHLNVLFGTGLPYFFNGEGRYIERYDIPAYRRVDIGFSKELIDPDKKIENRRFKHFNSLWMSLEVFNLLQINNTVSYLWVEDLNNNLYGVPNYLTGRRLNLKIIMRI